MASASQKTVPPAISASSPPRTVGLDALRGIAILSVIIFHAFIIRPFAHPWWARWVGQGGQGVGLFYLVSALTLALSWQYRQGRDSTPRLAFWARRFFRIAPLFYLLLVITGLFDHSTPTAAPASLRANPHTLGNLLAHLMFLFGWIPSYQDSWIGVEWSIGVEMTFYALFPWIISRLLPKWGGWRLFFLAAGISVAWPILLLHTPGTTWQGWHRAYLFWSFPSQVVWFGAGLLVFSQLRLRPRSPLWALLWAAAAIVLGSHPWMPRLANMLWVVPNTLLLWLTWHDLPILRLLTHNRILRYVGQRSYSLYLIHWVVFEAVVMPFFPAANRGGVQGFWIRGALALGISLLLSEIAYRYIEQPGIAWGKRWIAGQFPQRSSSLGRSPQAVPRH